MANLKSVKSGVKLPKKDQYIHYPEHPTPQQSKIPGAPPRVIPGRDIRSSFAETYSNTLLAAHIRLEQRSPSTEEMKAFAKLAFDYADVMIEEMLRRFNIPK